MSVSLYPTAVPSLANIGTLRIREDIAFANASGERKSGVEKTARKAAEKLQAELSKFLQPDETILFITKAQAPMSGLEQYSFGYMAQYVSAVMLVLTEKRLLGLRVNSSGKWDSSLRVCSWSDIESIKVSGWISKAMDIRFKSGQKERFWGIPRGNANVLAKLAPILLQQTMGMAATGDLVSLCPDCKAPLTKRVYQCAGCRLIFKNERTASWLSLIPGGAYFYCGRTLLGVLDLIGESYFLLAFAGVLLIVGAALFGSKQEDLLGALMLLGFFALLLALEIGITMFHAKRFVREFIPTKNHATEQPTAFASSAGGR